MAVPDELINEFKRRLAYLRSLGYETVPLDGSWGPWQENLWRLVTTRQKQYPVSPMGVISRAWDNITGNTTYRVEHPEGTIDIPQPKLIIPTEYLAKAGPAAYAASLHPYVAAGLLATAAGTALLSYNGPEIVRSANDVGRSIRSSTYNLIDKVIGNSTYTGDRVQYATASNDSTTTLRNDSTVIQRNDSTATLRPNPPSNNNEDPEKKKWRERVMSRIKNNKYLRRGLKTYVYTGLAAPAIDLAGNAIGRAYTPDSVEYNMKFPVTQGRFALGRGIYMFAADKYKEPTDTNNKTLSSSNKNEENEELSLLIYPTSIDTNTGKLIYNINETDSTSTLQEDEDVSNFYRKHANRN